MKRALKKLFEAWLRGYGYELREIGAPPRGFSACLSYARSRGLSPKTVFDVGVGWGTPWLYEAFPDAKHVLFEPLPVFEESLAELSQRLGADVHRVALADERGEADINLNIGYPTSSSLLTMDKNFETFAGAVQQRHEFRQERVSVETLDRLNTYEPPFVLKLDVEGSELKVLSGATTTLEKTEFIIAEVSVMRRQDGEPDFAEFIAFMSEKGFELFDVPSLALTSPAGQLIYLDAAFVRRGSGLWPG